jgi:hypothetical protein
MSTTDLIPRSLVGPAASPVRRTDTPRAAAATALDAHDLERRRVSASLLLLDGRDKPTRGRWA